MGQFRQPDFSKGDPNTLGGYMSVHDRPAAFEGADGFSYSVEILADDDHGASQPWGAYLFFIRWARIGSASPQGHLESDILARGESEADARDKVGRMSLSDVKRTLDELIARAPRDRPQRRWWDALVLDNGADDRKDDTSPGGGDGGGSDGGGADGGE